MKVILKSAVAQLGRAGDVKEVSAGFGRNYLIPNRLAEPATSSALAGWEKGKAKRAKLEEKLIAQEKEMAAKISGVALSFARQAGEEGKLFGSVGKTDIVKSLKSAGHSVDKNIVVLDSAIKQLGEYEVELRFRPDVTAKIKISVTARQ